MSNINEKDINFFSKKTGLTIERAKAILEEVGGLDNFREKYISLMLDREIEAHKEIVEYVGEMNELAIKSKMPLPLIQGFDLSQPNCIVSDKVISLLRRIDKKNNEIFGVFISEEDILSIKDKEALLVIMKYFGLNGYEKQKLATIAEKRGTSRQAVDQQIKIAIGKWLKEVNRKQREISEEKRQEFINEFFCNNDIFSEEIELTSEIKQKLSEIYNEGIRAVEAEREELRRKYEITPENIARRLDSGEKIYLYEIGFCERAINALKENRIETLQDFICEIVEWEQLYKMPYVGEKTIEEIKNILNKLQVTIYSETPEYQKEEQQEELPEKVDKNMLEQYDENIISAARINKITELGLNPETLKALEKASYTDVEQLCGIMDTNSIINIKGITPDRVKEIIEKMHSKHLYFRHEVEEPISKGMIAFWEYTKTIDYLNNIEKTFVENTFNRITTLVDERNEAFAFGSRFDTSHREELNRLLNKYSFTPIVPVEVDDMRAMKLAQFYEKDPSLFDETTIDNAEENSDKKSVDEILQILRIKEKEGNLPKSTRKILMFKIIEKTIPQQEKRTTQSTEEWRAGIDKIIEKSSETAIKTLFACACDVKNTEDYTLIHIIAQLREARAELAMEQEWYKELSAEREELLKGLNELLGDER